MLTHAAQRILTTTDTKDTATCHRDKSCPAKPAVVFFVFVVVPSPSMQEGLGIVTGPS